MDPTPRNDTGDDRRFQKWQRPLLEYKVNWNDDWSDGADAEPPDPLRWLKYASVQEVSLGVAPTLSRAVLQYEAGKIKREDSRQVVNYSGLPLLDRFVRISCVPAPTPDDPQPAPVRYFTGLVVDQSTLVGGDRTPAPTIAQPDPPRCPYLDMTYTALGLEYLLDEVVILSSMVSNVAATPDAAPVRIDQPLEFNDRFVRGISGVGNASRSQFLNGNDYSRRSKVFSKDGEVWTALSAVRYLLTWFTSHRGVTFTLDGVTDALDQIVVQKFSPGGMTIREALDHLIGRRSGLGWSVRYGGDGKPFIYVFSIFETDVTIGEATLPANPEQVTVDFSTSRDTADVHFGADTLRKYDQIRVSGQPVKVCFSVSFADGTLKEGWTPAEEAEYRNPTGGGVTFASRNDIARAAEKLSHVYTTFVIPYTWGWKVRDGLGHTPERNVNPLVTVDGEIDDTKSPPVRNFGKLLQHSLPLQVPTGFDAADPARLVAEFRLPLVLLSYRGRDGVTKWFQANVGVPGSVESCTGSVGMYDSDFAFQVRFNPAHMIAKNHFACGPDSPEAIKALPTSNGWNPQFDYKTMIATVCAVTDTPLRVVRGLPGRTIDIQIPDAEVWYIAPGTVLDVKADGTLVRQDAEPSENLVLRDDSPRLRAAAALAEIWYGRRRNTVAFTSRHIRAVGDFAAGGLIRTFQAGEPVDVNTIISRVTYNFAAQTTRVETSYVELDLREAFS